MFGNNMLRNVNFIITSIATLFYGFQNNISPCIVISQVICKIQRLDETTRVNECNFKKVTMLKKTVPILYWHRDYLFFKNSSRKVRRSKLFFTVYVVDVMHKNVI